MDDEPPVGVKRKPAPPGRITDVAANADDEIIRRVRLDDDIRMQPPICDVRDVLERQNVVDAVRCPVLNDDIADLRFAFVGPEGVIRALGLSGRTEPSPEGILLERQMTDGGDQQLVATGMSVLLHAFDAGIDRRVPHAERHEGSTPECEVRIVVP